MDVYALTRKERPRNPSMAPIQPAAAATTATTTTQQHHTTLSSSSWVSTASSLSSQKSSSRMSRPPSHGRERSETASAANITSTMAAATAAVPGDVRPRRSTHGLASWSGSSSAALASMASHQLPLSPRSPISLAHAGNGMGGGGSSGNGGNGIIGRARPGSLLVRGVSAGRVATPGVDRSWGEVTGLPTRVHWKPDDQSDRCSSFTCQKSFTLFERRHHCRRCGEIFCATCSANLLPLDQDAEYHPAGVMSRVCIQCMGAAQRTVAQREARRIDNGTESGAGSVASSPGASTDSATTVTNSVRASRLNGGGVVTDESTSSDRTLLRTPDQPAESNADAAVPAKGMAISTAQRASAAPDPSLNPIPSVPHDWTWSTF